ncbi:MAG: Hint domain-containing protein [Candidatus Nanopelagicaceae bacterium]|nr:Hint domain-containing protein [Candidatus Nanopelagicaceae bacterium]
MAIIGPENQPKVWLGDDNPLKLHTINQLGSPNVAVEVTEAQWEEAIKTTMDFIAQYFPLESKIAYFYTQPLVTEYDIPADAYWIKHVAWDPVSTRIDSIFGAECVGMGTEILTLNGSSRAYDLQIDDEVLSLNRCGELVKSRIVARKVSVKKCFRLSQRGRNINVSLNHGFRTENGWNPIKAAVENHLKISSFNGRIGNNRISSVNEIGEKEVIDFQVEPYHNFISNGFITHNSFLFCYPGGSNLLTTGGVLQAEEVFPKLPRVRIRTKHGNRKFLMRWNQRRQPITLLRTEKGFFASTPNHPVFCNGRFRMASTCEIGEKLLNSNDKEREIIDKTQTSTDGTWSVCSPSGSLFVGATDAELYLSH